MWNEDSKHNYGLWDSIYLLSLSILHEMFCSLFNKSHQHSRHSLNPCSSYSHRKYICIETSLLQLTWERWKDYLPLPVKWMEKEKLVDTKKPSHKSTINKYILLENSQLILYLWTDFVDLSFTFLCCVFLFRLSLSVLWVASCIWIFDSRVISRYLIFTWIIF